MSEITKRFSGEGGHWYRPLGMGLAEAVDAVPLKTPVKNDDGSVRTTTSPTVRHARELGLLRSVTGTIKMLSNEGLVKWLVEKALQTGYTLAMNDADLSIDAALKIGHQAALDGRGIEAVQDRWKESLSGLGDHLSRIEKSLAFGVTQEWERQRNEAPDRGKVIHACIERMILGQDSGATDDAARRACESVANIGKFICPERALGDIDMGYGCRLDAILVRDGRWRTVDFKTVTKPRRPLESELWQLAANDALVCNSIRKGGITDLNMDGRDECSLIYISQESGETLSIYNMPNEDREERYYEFKAILDLWCILNKHDVRRMNQ